MQSEKKIKKAEKALDAKRPDLVKNAADAAQEAQRQASQHNMALSEESLEEYRRLKASASKLAVDERQQLETLTRDEKTANRTLTTLTEKQKALEQKRDARKEELQTQTQKKAELDGKIASLQEDLTKAKQELDNQASERQRIKYAILPVPL
ncbi:hypothetical protein MPER_02634, partial [Moniliophthora perniciosa FA553]